jgi:hypothetical protein
MNTYPRYSVKPFSLWTKKTNIDEKEDSTPCAICGKQIKNDNQKAIWIVVVNGGEWARNEEEATNDSDPGFMGGWPVGSDCHKKYLLT